MEKLLTFPSQIHSTISSQEDPDIFNFTPEDTTDVILTLGGFWYYLSEDAPSCGQMATGW